MTHEQAEAERHGGGLGADPLDHSSDGQKFSLGVMSIVPEHDVEFIGHHHQHGRDQHPMHPRHDEPRMSNNSFTNFMVKTPPSTSVVSGPA